jgi:acetyl esterase
MDTDSHRKYGEGGFGVTTQTLRRRREQYLETEDQRYDPRVSPLLAEDLIGLPPALILTAEFDPLCDEAEEYAAKLDDTGVKVRCVRYLGVTHGFFNFVGFLPQADAALSEAALIIQHASPSLS